MNIGRIRGHGRNAGNDVVQNMQVILMAGGKGTRLRPFTNVLPKPLVPIGDISILEMVLRQLKYFGFEKVIIAVGYKSEIIMAVIGDGGKFGLEIEYHIEDKPLGTLGALSEMKGLEDNFLVMNGDICSNINFKDIFRYHVENQNKATIGVCRRAEKIELGVLDLDDRREKVISFKEKPIYEFFASIGVNVFSKEMLHFIPRKTFFGFDMLMQEMLANNIKISPYIFNGLWLDIGRPDDYNRMVEDFKTNAHKYLPEGA